jgi:integrase
VRDLIKTWRNRGNTEKTINRKLAALSKCMKYAKGEVPSLELPEMPFFKERKGRIRFLTPEEEHRMFNGLSPKHRAFSKFLLYTGCRVGEAVALEWQDVTGTHVTFWRTKGDRPRTVPLSERAKEALREGREAKGAKPWAIRYDAYNTDWQRAKAAAGLAHDPQVVPHVLRHTCASRLVQANVNLKKIQEWLGHGSIAQTVQYAHLARTDLDEAARALDVTSCVTLSHGDELPDEKTEQNQDGGVPEWLKGTDCKSLSAVLKSTD